MRKWILTAAGLAAGVGLASAEERDKAAKGTKYLKSKSENTMERAGYPQHVRPHATPVDNPLFAGGYVGGGRLLLWPRKADGRNIETDGTWGWDYVGIAHRRPGHVFLDWWHDRPKQPLPGTYTTELPEVPDPVGVHPFLKAAQGHPEEKKE